MLYIILFNKMVTTHTTPKNDPRHTNPHIKTCHDFCTFHCEICNVYWYAWEQIITCYLCIALYWLAKNTSICPTPGIKWNCSQFYASVLCKLEMPSLTYLLTHFFFFFFVINSLYLRDFGDMEFSSWLCPWLPKVPNPGFKPKWF